MREAFFLAGAVFAADLPDTVISEEPPDAAPDAEAPFESSRDDALNPGPSETDAGCPGPDFAVGGGTVFGGAMSLFSL